MLSAIQIEPHRDLEGDPAYGIAQLEAIAWTSISTSKQNPVPGLLVTQALRDLLARWSAEEKPDAGEVTVAPVVYRDNVLERLLGALESLGVVASESMQHQTAAEVMTAFASLFGRLGPEVKDQVEQIILRSLSGLGDHVLTAELERSLERVEGSLAADGRAAGADTVRDARRRLAGSIGELNSRATRVPQA